MAADVYTIKLDDEGGADITVSFDLDAAYQIIVADGEITVNLTHAQWMRAVAFIRGAVTAAAARSVEG